MSMSLEVPNGFLSLHDTEAHGNKEINVIGVVVEYLPPSKSKGSGQNYRLCR